MAKRAAKAAARKAAKRATQAIVGASTAGTSVAAEIGWRAAKPLLKLAVALLALMMVVAVFVLVGITAAAGSDSAAGGGATCAIEDERVPGELAPVYAAASSRFALGPRGAAMLAAINRVETDFGRNVGRSSAGAVGWMQFLPSTWAKGHENHEGRVVVPPTASTADGYATDGDDDGLADTDDAADAIHSAARYLQANGAPDDWNAAIYAYNHSSDYVNDVMTFADAFAGTCTEFVAEAPITAGARAKLVEGRLASIPESAPQPVKEMIQAANRIAHKPYVWGGGHGTATPTLVDAYDCSSAVSYVLHAGGLLGRTMVARDFESWGVGLGPGAAGGWVVVYANDGHVWMSLAGLVFDNYGSRGDRSMWSDHAVERVSSYVARRPPDGVGWS